jgi:hypothetical protein
LFFSLFFFKDSHKYVPVNKISKKMDPQLDTVVIGVKITRLDVSAFGAKVFTHVGINADVALAWQRAWR